MSVLDTKLRRDLWQARGMLAAVVAIIAAGIGSFVSMLGTCHNLTRARDDYYTRCSMADFWIDLKKAPVSEARRLCALLGVASVHDRIVFSVTADLEGVDEPISGIAISMPPTQVPVINGLLVRAGSYFTGQRQREVILSEKFARSHGLRPGHTLQLVMNGQCQTWYVVGTAISPEFVYMAPGDYGIFFVRRDDAEEAFGFKGACNSLVGQLTPAARAAGATALFDELKRALEEYGVFAVTPRAQQFSNLTLRSELGGLQTMATMLPLMFLGVAALVLNVLLTRMTEQQRVVIGTLKALGYGNRVLRAHFLKFALLVGLAGAVLGVTLGHLIAGGMNQLYKSVFSFPLMRNAWQPALVLVAVAIALVFALLGALRGVRKVSGLPPAEAMREAAPAVVGAIALERWTWFWGRLDFRWQVVLRGLFRNKGRTLVSMLAAVMGAALIVMALGFVNSMNGMLAFQFDKVMLSQYTLNLADGTGAEAVDEIRRWPGVTLAEGVLDAAGMFEYQGRRKQGTISGLMPGARLTVPCNAAGQQVPVPANGLLMTRRLADQIGVRPGDTVWFTPVKGARRPCQLAVAGLIESMLGLGVYADYRYLTRILGEAGALSQVQVRAAQTPAQCREFLRQAKGAPRLQSLVKVAEQKANLQDQFHGAMLGMAVAMILFAGVIFLGSILNGSLIAMAERRREIATFRVLGYRATEVGAMFWHENIVVNLLGAVLGLPVGYALLAGMMTQYSNDAYQMPAMVAPASYAWTLVLTVVFVGLSHALVQWSINRLNWGEALNMKE